MPNTQYGRPPHPYGRPPGGSQILGADRLDSEFLIPLYSPGTLVPLVPWYGPLYSPGNLGPLSPGTLVALVPLSHGPLHSPGRESTKFKLLFGRASSAWCTDMFFVFVVVLHICMCVLSFLGDS